MKWSRLVISAGLVLAVAQACGSDDQGFDDRRRRDAGADGSSGTSDGSAGDGGSAGNPGVGGTAGTGVGGTAGSGGTGAGGTAGGGGVDGSAAAGGTGGARDGGGGSAGTPDGGGGSAGGPIFSCGTFATTCSSGAQCCSKVCNPATNRCAASSTCSVAGTSCSAPTDCCSQRCQGNVCQAAACVSDGGVCSVGTQCCSGTCESGQCKALNLECKTAGNTCSGNSQCCSKLCKSGKCELRSSYCTQMGDVCSRAEECCTGRCDKNAGATLGTCGDAPSGATNCSGRGVEGSVCASGDGGGDMVCNECCSRLCAPYGPTGVFVCQPASGCHVNGDFCRTNNDCCGAAGTGLPGDGNVTCQKDASATLGVCRNPMGCNPQGNVCHYKGSDGGYVCGGSSSRNNCCGDTGDQDGTCQLDTLGVPRCNGLGACRTSGTTCASADDCCNNAPCVPDSAGVLRCYAVPDGGRSCVPTAGPCTINGDCCPGAICLRPVGSTRGVCGVITTTPPTDGGTPGDGGVKDGGAGGSSGSGGAGGSGGVPQCSEYGQQCQSSSNCCNAVPCNGGICRFFG